MNEFIQFQTLQLKSWNKSRGVGHLHLTLSVY